MKYKCIIYDLDGTVIDTEEMNFIPLQRLVKEELKKDIPYSELIKYKANAGLKTIEVLGFKDIDKSYEKWVKYVNEYEGSAKLFEGFKEVIEEADRKGVVQGIASSKMRNQYEIDFFKTGLHKFMKCEVLAEDTLEHKPHPAPILKAIEILGVDPSEVVYVGDALSDYKAAKAAKVGFAFAKWGNLDLGVEDIDHILEKPEDLLKLF